MMMGISRSPEPSRMGSGETDRDDSPPPAPDVTADPRAPKCQSSPSSTTMDRTSVIFNGPPLTGLRNNEVRSVMLYGIPIVALVIDGYERLCLAQISNTLLKTFSYNEIHNRRVALGITCVQCTPVQLELLRRAGAMPVSSRRCGLITKREAERLCKSFLADTRPPKLPDNFAFEVVHQCAWGCRGSFVPSRYNSSRAKCIKCAYCGLFFSPNKFIFHSHRLPDSKYVQPDAANFNSWRRHIKLGGSPPDEVVYAWEDVKAMFNGGSRKRILSCHSSSSSSRSQDHKRSRVSSAASVGLPDSSPVGVETPHHHHPAKNPYFPVVPLPKQGFALQPNPGGAAFVSPTGPPFGLSSGKQISPADIRQTFAEYMWSGKQPFPLPYGGMFWPRPTGIVPQGPATPDLREPVRSHHEKNLPYSLADTTTLTDSSRPLSSASEGTSRSFPDHADESGGGPPRGSPSAHASAFRPVTRNRGSSSAAIASTLPSAEAESTADTTTPTSDHGFEGSSYPCCSDRSNRHDSSDHDEVDVTDVSNDADMDSFVVVGRPVVDGGQVSPDGRSVSPPDLTSATPDTSDPYGESKGSKKKEILDEENVMNNPSADSLGCNRLMFHPMMDKIDPLHLASSAALKSGRTFESLLMDAEKISALSKGRSKDELKEVLIQEAEARRRAEREYQVIRDTFEEQVRKEIAYREEVAKQLQIVREAHNALHHFSCKMLATRHCAECGFKPPVPE